MPAETQDSPGWAAPLADWLRDGANTEQVADAVVSIWTEIDRALYPIIGHRGVAALYNRSLSLTAVAHPWLGIGHQGVLAAVDPSALKAALRQQSAAEATAGGNALFQSFQALLASLVGPSLTNRLLRPVWAHSSGASPAQDTSS